MSKAAQLIEKLVEGNPMLDLVKDIADDYGGRIVRKGPAFVTFSFPTDQDAADCGEELYDEGIHNVKPWGRHGLTVQYMRTL